MNTLAIVLGLLCCVEVAATVPPRDILVAIYENTHGSGWKHNTGWLSARSECTWYGVKCTHSGSIDELVLQNNRLRGTLPDQLSLLTELVHLELGEDDMSGTIPPQVTTAERFIHTTPSVLCVCVSCSLLSF